MNRIAPSSRPLQPDLLRVLKVLACVRVALAVIFLAVAVLALGHFSPAMPLPVITSLLVFGFVVSRRVEGRLGVRHMPLAILLLTVDSLLISGYFPKAMLATPMPGAARAIVTSAASALSEPWLLGLGDVVIQSTPPFLPQIVLISLFLLLIVVCWLYPMRVALLYIIGTTVSDIVLVLLLSTWPLQGLTLLAFILARTIIFLILAAVITQLVSQQYKQQDSLQTVNAKLARYVSVVEELTISRERNRLARELHDTLAHTLSAASVQLEAANSLWQTDSTRSHVALEQAMGITRDGLSETRRALKALRASPLDDLGLVLALQELGELTRQRSGAQMKISLPAQLEPLPAEVEQTLYRTAQEALENVVRHARARQVELSLWQQGATLHLVVHDDGVGFDASSVHAQSERYGLSGMEERILALGGHMSITSAPAAGLAFL